MKKQYKKPYLALESFQLDAALAAACSTTSRTPIRYGEENCSYPIDSGQFFSLFNCQIDVTDGSSDGNDTLCYHGPELANGIVFTFS